jgi:AAA15 family ATPase/GTPase
MEYEKFIIENYRAITGPLEVNVGKKPLIPIIGVNECGKTTILSAIFAFDLTNDTLNGGRHLKDTQNLYGTSPGVPKVSADISLKVNDVLLSLENARKKATGETPATLGQVPTEGATRDPGVQLDIVPILEEYKVRRDQFPTELTLTRDLATRRYAFKAVGFENEEANHRLGFELVRFLPYILFFDDFRDSVDETIKIVGTKATATGWLSIIEQLFMRTNPKISVFDLPTMEERRRKSVLAKVRRHLNETLTKEWQNFRLDDSDALEISIEFQQQTNAGTEENVLKLEIIETDGNGDAHYFFIRDRSKGFFWFFNFVMKLEFNPKVLNETSATVYLLDEPGSYLHASAQAKLCRKLRQLSSRNRVIYCTHSHYLLDPEVIPISSIRVAEKSDMGSVQLVSIHDYSGNITERRSAFQPIIDALQIKPVMADVSQQGVLITEGIYDYYALELFRQARNISILPSVGADSIPFYISLMIAWRIPYKALWDNDKTGRASRQKAEKLFGEEEAKDRFFVLPSSEDCILQNLFTGDDLVMIRESLSLPNGSSFEKTIAALHFDSEKASVLAKFTEKTRSNFSEVYAMLGL